MDQTTINIYMNPNTKLAFAGARNVDVVQAMSPNSFDQVCFYVHPLLERSSSLWLVLQGPNGSVRNEVMQGDGYPSNKASFATQANAYCDESIICAWIDNVWGPRLSSASVLLIDSLKSTIFEIRWQPIGTVSDQFAFCATGGNWCANR
ncbi:TPA: hypothetical protein N0F65_002689 [Lagenidium giganteum]|uniref:DOMON domain-containing protein n=1 Tax=Lagenidium giganteum TaxID=4803 RepID=A0AAV2Z6Q8_9STRA|nr:TPA: hypothetical protein N0F65_002689 [Lagenidium giganteum]